MKLVMQTQIEEIEHGIFATNLATAMNTSGNTSSDFWLRDVEE